MEHKRQGLTNVLFADLFKERLKRLTCVLLDCFWRQQTVLRDGLRRTTGYKCKYVISDELFGDSQMTKVVFSLSGIVTPSDKCDALNLPAANLISEILERFIFIKGA